MIDSISPILFSVEHFADFRGDLCCLELSKNADFHCQRIYYLLGNENLNARGFHAHKELKQIIICMQGPVKIEIEDRTRTKHVFSLDNPKTALYVPPGCWREIYPLEKNSIVVVLASLPYSEDDYIKDKPAFYEYCEKINFSDEKRLSNTQDINLATEKLNYESFRLLAKNSLLTQEEKIGFPTEYRQGYENHILNDISSKLSQLQGQNKHILDIGCGCGSLTNELIKLCEQQKHHLYLVDSPEMLSHIPDKPFITKIGGLFPQNIEAIRNTVPLFDSILCYSVLHYAFIDTNLFSFIDSLLSLLNIGGSALIGDIPNYSKRKRLFSSPTGIAYHQQFMNTLEKPTVNHFEIAEDKIDDSVLQAIISRAQLAGYDAYLMPQNDNLPMANRRDDLLIRRP